MIFIKTKQDVETRFDTSIYELQRPSPKGKNKKVVGKVMNQLELLLKNNKLIL